MHKGLKGKVVNYGPECSSGHRHKHPPRNQCPPFILQHCETTKTELGDGDGEGENAIAETDHGAIGAAAASRVRVNAVLEEMVWRGNATNVWDEARRKRHRH